MTNQDGAGNLGIEQIVWNNSIPCSQFRLDKLHLDDFLMKNGRPCWTYYQSNLICCPCHRCLASDYGPQDGKTCLSMIWHHYIEIWGIWRFKVSRKKKNKIKFAKNEILKHQFGYLSLDFVPRHWTLSCKREKKGHQHKQLQYRCDTVPSSKHETGTYITVVRKQRV